MRHSKLRRYCAIAASTLLASSFTIHLPTDTTHLQVTVNAASARSTGARSGGGSFRSTPSRSSGSSSSGSSSAGSRSFSGNSDRGSSYQRNDRYPGGGSTVIVPVPGGPTVYSDPYRNGGYNSNGYNNSNDRSTSSGIGWIVALFFVGVSALIVLGLVYMIYRANKGTARGGSSARDRELSNDTVTISKIQVALLAQAREIQAELTSLSLEIDTSTPDGLLLLLQESVLALLRTPENWSHVLASSQTVKSLDEAEAIFNRISIAERSKFSVETLTNVGGRVSKRDGFKPDPDEDPASYIVVTLLVGTAHDHPLFDKIQTEQALRDTLEKLASLPADYLMVFELLWSPQDASDSLTYDELLTEYTDMAQI